MKTGCIVVAVLVILSLAAWLDLTSIRKEIRHHQGLIRQQRLVLGEKKAQAYMEKGRQELLLGSAAKALVWLNRAYTLSQDPPYRLRFMLARAMDQFFGNDFGVSSRNRQEALIGPGEDPDIYLRGLNLSDLITDRIFSPDSSKIVTADSDEKHSEITILDTASHKVLLTIKLPSTVIEKALFDATGRYIVAYGLDNTLHVLDAKTGKPLYRRKLTQTVHDIFLTGDGKYCVVLRFCPLGIPPLLVLDLERLEPVSLACGDRFEVGHDPSYAPRTSLLASAGTYYWGSTIMVYSINRHDCLSRMYWPTREGPMAAKSDFLTSNLAFDPQGWFLLGGMNTGTVYLWDLHEDNQEPKVIFVDDSQEKEVYWVSFSSDGTQVLALDSDQRIKVRDLRDNRLYTIGEPGILQADYSPETGLVGTLTREHVIDLYDLASGEKIFTPDMEIERPAALRFVGGNKLAVETVSGLIRLLDISGWQFPPEVTNRLVRCYVPYTIKNDRLQPALTEPGACGDMPRQLLPRFTVPPRNQSPETSGSEHEDHNTQT